MEIIKNISKKLNYTWQCFLFTAIIFLWDIKFEYLQFRFLIVFLIFPILMSFNSEIFIKCTKYFFIVLLVFIHSFFQSEIITPRIAYSIGMLFILFLIFDVYKNFFFKNLDMIISLFLIIFFGFIVKNFFSYDDYFTQVSKTCLGCFSILKLFFKENSHFAMIAPFVIFYFIFLSKINKFMNYISFILFVLLCYTNPSTTMIAGLLLTFFLSSFFIKKISNNNKIVIFIFILITSVLLIKDNRFNSKINEYFIVKENNRINLSTEVLKISHFIAIKSIINKPLGYGFNNYEEAFNEYINLYEVEHIESFHLNKKDASNNFSKIVTEFGIFSLFFFYFIISFIFRDNIDVKIKLFLIIPIIIQTFIRGGGYFNGGFLLFLYFAYSLWVDSKRI